MDVCWSAALLGSAPNGQRKDFTRLTSLAETDQRRDNESGAMTGLNPYICALDITRRPMPRVRGGCGKARDGCRGKTGARHMNSWRSLETSSPHRRQPRHITT